MTGALRPALFLDRDGVVNVDHGYVSTWERFDYVEGVHTLVRAANRAGWAVVIATNQSGIARGYFCEAQLQALHDRLIGDMAARGARIDAIYHCPHLPGCGSPAYDRDSDDRKPRPGMLLRAARELGLDLSRSAMIGDRETDTEAASAAGVAGHLFPGGDLWAFAAERIPGLRSPDWCEATPDSPPRRLPASDSSAPTPPRRRVRSSPR